MSCININHGAADLELHNAPDLHPNSATSAPPCLLRLSRFLLHLLRIQEEHACTDN